MKKLYIANTAVFTSVAALHLLRMIFETPLTIGEYEIELWLSALAAAGTGVLAWLNWRAVGKHGRTDWLWLLIALLLVDAFIVFYAWVAEITYWGISGDTFLWFVLIDLVLVGIVHGFVRSSGRSKKR